MNIRIKKLRPNAQLPVYSSDGAAGADLRACLEEAVTIQPGQTVMIPLGLAIEIPEGYVGLAHARSGMATKRGIAPANKVGVIDSDFRGEMMAALHNHGSEPQTIEPGDRVLQLLIVPCVQAVFEEADALSDTRRGEGGWGSTGRA
ncbi:MAG: dUTP diphosphatase [Clostridia bacterium]|nr:dUTP diphosphatase [Clostridia bacterium]